MNENYKPKSMLKWFYIHFEKTSLSLYSKT